MKQKNTIRSMTAGAMAFLLCVLAVMPAFMLHVSAFSSYEGISGVMTYVPYPQEPTQLQVTSVEIDLAVTEFPDEHLGEDPDRFWSYSNRVTFTVTYYNPTDQLISVNMRWDSHDLPYYAIEMKTAENVERYIDWLQIKLDGLECSLVPGAWDEYSDQSWIGYLTYPMTVEAGQSVVNEVSCPIFPSVEDQYDPPVYRYSINTQPLETTTQYDCEVLMRVHTEYELAYGSWFYEGRPGDLLSTSTGRFDSSDRFEKTDDGYACTERGDDRSYHNVVLSTKRHQSNPYAFWDNLRIIIIVVPVMLVLAVLAIMIAVIAAIVLVTVLVVRKKRARKEGSP